MVRLQAWKRQNGIVSISLVLPELTQKHNRKHNSHTHTRDSSRGRDTAKLASTVNIHATLNTCHLRLSVFSSDYPPMGHPKRPKSALIAALFSDFPHL